MISKTPEERKIIAAKSHATRRRNKLQKDKDRYEAEIYANGLGEKIKEREAQLAALDQLGILDPVAVTLTNKQLLPASFIVSQSKPWSDSIGVYFLIHNNSVVYVGQSVNVFTRIGQHTDKTFDRFAYIPCKCEHLDALESLYIHTLRPQLNGMHRGKGEFMCAPLAFDDLLTIIQLERAS